MSENKTTAGDLVACLTRLIDGEFVVPETLVYLLSRDGHQLRPIKKITRSATRYIQTGKKVQLPYRLLIQGTPEEQETITVAQLLAEARKCEADERVKVLADGFGLANWVSLGDIMLNAEIFDLVTETYVLLCSTWKD